MNRHGRHFEFARDLWLVFDPAEPENGSICVSKDDAVEAVLKRIARGEDWYVQFVQYDAAPRDVTLEFVPGPEPDEYPEPRKRFTACLGANLSAGRTL